MTLLEQADLGALCDPALFKFETTAELSPLLEPIGQEEALDVLQLAADIPHSRFNVFVYGADGTGRHAAVLNKLQSIATKMQTPDDWVYLFNFANPDCPLAVRLDAGNAPRLKSVVAAVLEDLADRIPSVLVSDEYQERRLAVEQTFQSREDDAFEVLVNQAEEQKVSVTKTATGFSIVPIWGDDIPDEGEVDVEITDEMDKALTFFQRKLEEFLATLPEIERQHREAISQLNSSMAEQAVILAMRPLFQSFGQTAQLTDYLNALRSDLIANADVFMSWDQARSETAFPMNNASIHSDRRFNRYAVNIITSGANDRGAPVLCVGKPSLTDIAGRIDHFSEQGALLTDFTQIKAGALHAANGGFLVLDAERLLADPLAWEVLKHCLKDERIHLRDSNDVIGGVLPSILDPEPIPLKVRVVLIGDIRLQRLISEIDPDFSRFFRLVSEFKPDVARTKPVLQKFARLLAKIAQDESLRPLTRDAVALLVELASRRAEDKAKLALDRGYIVDLLLEANLKAAREKQTSIVRSHIEQALSDRQKRGMATRETVLEQIKRNTHLIKLAGSEVGQINGLVVSEDGDFRFGSPMRITSRVRMGTGKLVDIEREVATGGPIYSKSVLILSGFIAGRYATDVPLSLSGGPLWLSSIMVSSKATVPLLPNFAPFSPPWRLCRSNSPLQ